MAEVRERKKDWVPVLAVGLGGTALAAGLYLYTRKPPGVSPGDKIRAGFAFDYLRDGGDYILLVRFGRYQPWYEPLGFDPEEGMDRYRKEVFLPGPDSYQFDVDCVIPDGAKPETYDAEASILSVEMEPGEDWIIRTFSKKVVNVREE